MKNLDDVFAYLDTINDVDNPQYLDCKWHSYDNEEWYKKILEKVLEDKPKRVIDIGGNLNQYAYLFVNEGIEYIGIDSGTCVPTNYGLMQPIITDKIKFIPLPYEQVRHYFVNDVIISCLCVDYLVPIRAVKAKRLIINDLDKDGKPIAKEVK